MTNPYGHLDVRVTSMDDALPFYSAFMPELGFTREYLGTEWKVWVAEGDVPSVAHYGIIEDPAHAPNLNRIAFWAPTRDEVDRLARVAAGAGARVTDGPRDCPEYGEGWYAVYFEDPSGNRLEVVYRTM